MPTTIMLAIGYCSSGVGERTVVDGRKKAAGQYQKRPTPATAAGRQRRAPAADPFNVIQANRRSRPLILVDLAVAEDRHLRRQEVAPSSEPRSLATLPFRQRTGALAADRTRRTEILQGTPLQCCA